MENFKLQPKTYQRTKKSLHINTLRPDMQEYMPNLPWHDFSFEGGYIFSHLDGAMVGTYKTEKQTTTSIIES